MMNKYEVPLPEEEGEEFLQHTMITVPETNEKTKGRKAAAEELSQLAQVFINKGAGN